MNGFLGVGTVPSMKKVFCAFLLVLGSSEWIAGAAVIPVSYDRAIEKELTPCRSAGRCMSPEKNVTDGRESNFSQKEESTEDNASK